MLSHHLKFYFFQSKSLCCPFHQNNIDWWVLSNNSIFPLSPLIVFISPPHLPISLCLQGDILIVQSPARKLTKTQPLNPGSTLIFCTWLTITINYLFGKLRDKCHTEMAYKRFTIRKSFLLVMHLDKGKEYQVGYYCHNLNPNPPSPLINKKTELEVQQGAPFLPL